MIDLIASRAPDIAALCRRLHVERLDLFGSAAREQDFTPESDIDLAVQFDRAWPPPRLRDYIAFKDELSSLFGRKVDLTMYRAVRNPFMKAAIDRDRRTLYAA